MKSGIKMNDYIKIVYQSEPIGKEKIILQLTTFDIEKFKENENLKNIPMQRKAVLVTTTKSELDRPDFRFKLEQNLNYIVENEYKKQIEEMKREIEFLRGIKICPQWSDSNVKD